MRLNARFAWILMVDCALGVGVALMGACSLEFPPSLECSTDADCDDGAFCNGTETCDGSNCQAGEPPCGEGLGACPDCIEVTQGCVLPCFTDADCADGIFCNGVEICANCGCHPGEPPCGDLEGSTSCDEERDQCP